MKALKKSMRENKRYLLIRLSQARSGSSNSQTKGKNLKEKVESAILDFIGVLGMSKVDLSWIKSGSNSAVICISRGAVDSVRASFCVCPEKIEVVKVSGTLKGLSR